MPAEPPSVDLDALRAELVAMMRAGLLQGASRALLDKFGVVLAELEAARQQVADAREAHAEAIRRLTVRWQGAADGWKERATAAEAEVAALRTVCTCGARAPAALAPLEGSASLELAEAWRLLDNAYNELSNGPGILTDDWPVTARVWLEKHDARPR